MIGKTSPRTITAVAAAACLLAAGCSSSSAPAANNSTAQPRPPSSSHANSHRPSSPPPSAATATITIKDFSYAVSGTAAGGSTVRVTNNDSETHTVTADSGHAFDVTVEGGKTAVFTAPTHSGSYKFHCNFHSDMHGNLVVS